MAEDALKIDRETLKVFGSDTRIQIMKKLQDRQMTASELSKVLGKHVTTVTEHLEVLEHKNLVQRVERPGRKWVYYKLTGTGEKLSSPTSHNFIFGILGSIAAIFSGVFLLSYQALTIGTDLAAPETMAITATVEKSAAIPAIDYFLPGVILVLAGLAILIYAIYRRIRIMKNLGILPLY
jgi:DNA-binding transcriptional ArsR family regulator